MNSSDLITKIRRCLGNAKPSFTDEEIRSYLNEAIEAVKKRHEEYPERQEFDMKI